MYYSAESYLNSDLKSNSKGLLTRLLSLWAMLLCFLRRGGMLQQTLACFANATEFGSEQAEKSNTHCLDFQPVALEFIRKTSVSKTLASNYRTIQRKSGKALTKGFVA